MLIDNYKSMLQIIKKCKLAMNVVVLILVFFLVYMGVSVAHKVSEIEKNKQVTDASLRDTITVKGEAEIDIVPDVASLSFGVVTEAKTVEVAQTEGNDDMSTIVAGLKKEGVKENDLKTSNYSIYPRYSYNRETGVRSLAGYEVSQTIGVKVRDFDKVGDIIQLASDAGANQIGSLNFMIDDEIAARAEARGEAIKNAKTKAKTLAKQLGIKLGDIVNFYESSDSQPYYRYDMSVSGMGGDMEESAVAPSIEPGTNQISVSVELVYEIVH